ncbi:MAG: BrnA antitoxin family protein [Methylococcales bacterium]
MANRLPLTDEDGEVRELTKEDFKRFRPAVEVLSPSLLKKLELRGSQKAPNKERITIRLSREVVDRFRATGNGWQSRMDEALKEWIKSHPPA